MKATQWENKYILTIVVYAVKLPEAMPLRNIEVKPIAEALLIVFATLCSPQEIAMMEELLQACEI